MIDTKDNVTNTKVLRPKTKSSSIKTRIKYKKLIKEIMEKPEQSMKESLEAVGYSSGTALNPHQITQRPSFIALMDENGLTDNFLQDKLKEGFEATKLVLHGKDVLEPIDYMARHKYLETALKAKHHLQPDTQYNTQVNDYKVIIEE